MRIDIWQSTVNFQLERLLEICTLRSFAMETAAVGNLSATAGGVCKFLPC